MSCSSSSGGFVISHEIIKRGGLPNTVKAGLKLLGFDAGVPRPPLLELEDPAVAELARLLADVGAAA
jgi:4-hydroxy-tetrahydrodipicolinate synthase